MSTNAIADTSFLIDWAKYSKRDLLFKIFDTVWLPEAVLNEIKSENTVMWVVKTCREEEWLCSQNLQTTVKKHLD